MNINSHFFSFKYTRKWDNKYFAANTLSSNTKNLWNQTKQQNKKKPAVFAQAVCMYGGTVNEFD